MFHENTLRLTSLDGNGGGLDTALNPGNDRTVAQFSLEGKGPGSGPSRGALPLQPRVLPPYFSSRSSLASRSLGKSAAPGWPEYIPTVFDEVPGTFSQLPGPSSIDVADARAGPVIVFGSCPGISPSSLMVVPQVLVPPVLY